MGMKIFDLAKTVVKHSITTSDGESYDLGRILWIAGTVVFFILCFHSIGITHTFDPIAYGTGFGALMVGCGGALGLKKGTEPKD